MEKTGLMTVSTAAVDRMSSRTSASIRGKNSDPSELRIVLIGGRHGSGPSGKSSVGNIILGRNMFKESQKTFKSVMRQDHCGQVTVVDTPGWSSSHPLDLTPKLTQLEIQQSVNLCPPGPHAFVLVVRLDSPYVGTGMSAEEHVRFLLSDRVWKHTIVVFTVADNNMRPDLIRSDNQLRGLIEKCDGRFHVLNIRERGQSQGRKLLEKIDQMVTSNGCHYETEEHVLEELKEKLRTIRRRADERRTDAQKERAGLPKHIDGLTDLRIVLFGRQASGKSSAGNTILRGIVFEVLQRGQRSVQCEVRQGKVAGRHVTVVDSPGWFYNSPLEDISEMDKLEIQNSVRLCPPGPHAVLLMVVLYQAFTKAQRVALEEHMTLLSQRAWSHSIVLFTCGDFLGDRSIEQHIEAEGEDLRWLVDKCGNRYHVFNKQNTGDTQVTQLMEKIEEMVTGNRGGHYEVDGDEKMSERKRIIEEHVQTFLKKTHRQRHALKALSEGEPHLLPDVKLMLVGSEQNERNTAGNRILQDNVFTEIPHKEFKIKTLTKLTQCVRQQRRVADRKVRVVICPDWSTAPPSQKIKDVLLHGVTLCSPGPHAILVTVDVTSNFSEADRRSVEEHMELLGDRVWRHTLVLFTQGFWLGRRRVEEYIESEGEPLRWLLEKCGYRYHVLDVVKWDISEVTELMEKTEDMVMMNREHTGPLESREDSSVRDTGHFQVGHETRQKTLFDRLKGKKTVTKEEWNRREEEWKKREQEMRERMSRFVVTEPEESAVKRGNTMDLEDAWSMDHPPCMSGGTPSETESLCSWSSEVSSSHCGSTAPSSGYGSMSDVMSQASADDEVPLMKTMFHRLKGKQRLTEEDWNRRQEELRRREQEMIDRMLKFVGMEPEEPSLPDVRRSNSMDLSPPSMSVGTSSETLRHLSPDPGPIAPSSGADTMSEAPNQTDTEALCLNMSSEEEENEDSEDCMDMMKMMEIESGEEERKKTDLDDYDNDEVYLGSCCEKCQHVQQSYGNEMIIPEKLSRGRMQAQLEGQGTYECAFTGLIFEPLERVLVSYSILSWSKFNKFVQDPWMIAGPIFNVHTVDKDAAALKSIQLPHSLCLAGQEKKKVFGVLHVTGKDPVIERAQSSGSHLKWSMSSLSPVGVIVRDAQEDEHHGAVLVYKVLGSSISTHTFRIYLSSCNSSHMKDIKKKLKKGRFSSVDKNFTCRLGDGNYHLMSEPSGEIDPQDLPFTLKSTVFRGFFEAYFERPPPFKFTLKASDVTDVTAWTATIRQDDLMGRTEKTASLLKQRVGQFFQRGSRKRRMCGATVSLQEQQSLHPESEPNIDSHHVQSDVSSTTALKPSLSIGFSNDETGAEGLMRVAGASAVREPQISQTTDNFVRKNWSALVQRVTVVMGIADDLLEKGILTIEMYNEIWSAAPHQTQMRKMLVTVELKGSTAISAFYEALQNHESCLLNDLRDIK